MCAAYSDTGDCTLCNHIRAALVRDIPSGLYKCAFVNSGNSICDKSEDGCTCASCKNTWTLSNGDCPLNVVSLVSV